MRLPRLRAPDLAIVLGFLVLSWVAAAPRLGARSARLRTESAVANVDAAAIAALEARESSGDWPTSPGPGVAPPELGSAFPGDSAFVFEGYVLEWRTLGTVEWVEVPPEQQPTTRPGDAPPDSASAELRPVARSVGALAVHAQDSTLLASLLTRYGAERSFVRDSTWTVIVDDRRPLPSPASPGSTADGRTPGN